QELKGAAKESAKFGVATEDMQILGRMAEESDQSVEKLVKTLKSGGDAAQRLREQMEEVRNATGKVIDERTVARNAYYSDEGAETSRSATTLGAQIVTETRNQLRWVGRTWTGF